MNGRFARQEGCEPVAEERTGSGEVGRPLRPKQCRSFAKKRMAEALPEIVERFVREAKQGSIPHAKALVALSGLDQVEAPNDGARERARDRKRRSLTEMLLQELKRGRKACDEGAATESDSADQSTRGCDERQGGGLGHGTG